MRMLISCEVKWTADARSGGGGGRTPLGDDAMRWFAEVGQGRMQRGGKGGAVERRLKERVRRLQQAGRPTPKTAPAWVCHWDLMKSQSETRRKRGSQGQARQSADASPPDRERD